MRYLGSFHAQQREWIGDLSVPVEKDMDINTIYEFLVFTDRIFLLRAGNAVTDMKRVLNEYVTPLGVRPFDDSVSTAGAEARVLEGARQLLKSHKLNREIPLGTRSRCEVHRRHLLYLGFYGSVVLRFGHGRKMVYLFRTSGEWKDAWRVIQPLGDKAALL